MPTGQKVVCQARKAGNRLFRFYNLSVEACVFGNLRSAWSYGDHLATQCLPCLLPKRKWWPHSLGSGPFSKAFDDCLSKRVNEMQHGGRTDPVLLRERAPVLVVKLLLSFIYIFFLLNLLKDQLWFQFNFFFFFQKKPTWPLQICSRWI